MNTIEQLLEKFYECCNDIHLRNSHYTLSFKFARLMDQLSHRTAEIPEADLANIRRDFLLFALHRAAVFTIDYIQLYFERSSSANHPILGNLNDFADEINLHWDHDNGLNLTAATIRRYTQREEENTATLINTPSNTPRLFGQALPSLELDDVDDVDSDDLDSADSADSYIKFHP